MQRGPNWSALRTPVQSFTGWGSRQRRSPTGACPNGIPLKMRTPSFGAAVDSITPFAIRTWSAASACPASGRVQSAQRATEGIDLFMESPSGGSI